MLLQIQCKSDFDNQHWNDVFEAFKGGPDWISEQLLAMMAIQRWRIAVLEEYSDWQHNVEELQMAHDKALNEYNTTHRLDSYFKLKSGRYFFTRHLPFSAIF